MRTPLRDEPRTWQEEVDIASATSTTHLYKVQGEVGSSIAWPPMWTLLRRRSEARQHRVLGRLKEGC